MQLERAGASLDHLLQRRRPRGVAFAGNSEIDREGVKVLQASSYRGATTTSTTLVVNEAFAPDVVGRDVLLLDDILDTGRTLGALVDHLKDRGATSVRTAVLLRKIGRQIIPLEPDYCGFVIPDAFVVGYGLDYNDEYRHLPYVGVLRQ